MVVPEITKAINGLKTNADRLNPKPSDAFLKVYKAESNSVLSAAKSFDRTLADKNSGDHKEDYTDLVRTTNKYFDGLLALAKKEPDLINAKLQKYVSAVQKDVLGTADDEYKSFLKVSAATAAKPDPGLLKSLKERADAAERGRKATAAYRAEAEKTLATIKANRAKGGEDALVESQKLLYELRLSEARTGQHPDYLKGKKPLKPEHLTLLKQARQDEATKLKLAGELAANASESLMDAGRNMRGTSLREIQAHHDEVQKEQALDAKNNKGYEAQVKQLQADFKKLAASSSLTLDQTSKGSWEMLKEMTEENEAQHYKELLELTNKAYQKLSATNAKLTEMNKRVSVLRGQLPPGEHAESAASLRADMNALQVKFRTANFAQSGFKKLVAECDKKWKERA